MPIRRKWQTTCRIQPRERAPTGRERRAVHEVARRIVGVDGQECLFCRRKWEDREDVERTNPVVAAKDPLRFACQCCYQADLLESQAAEIAELKRWAEHRGEMLHKADADLARYKAAVAAVRGAHRGVAWLLRVQQRFGIAEYFRWNQGGG